jgi:hypothetical protein
MTIALCGLQMDFLFGKPDYSYVLRTFSPTSVPAKPMRKKAIGSTRKLKNAVKKAG